LLDLASREPERLSTWSCAIAEAGLGSPAVANSLARSSVTLWAAQAEQVKKEHRWFRERIVKRTPYTECVSIACNSFVKTGQFPLVEQLRTIRSPGNDRIVQVISLTTLVMIVLTVLMAYITNFIETPHLHWLIILIITISLILAEITFILAIRTQMARKNAYLYLISLSAEEDKTFDLRYLKVLYFVFTANTQMPETLNRLFVGRRQVDIILRYLKTRQAAATIAVTSANSATSC
jgi:hypothetical protein